jgi:two-component system chemotaxis response regulator CheB
MVVDDSMIVRQLLKDIIDSDPRFECKWTAINGVNCVEQLKSHDCNPDVITLDVEMPHLDGLETLKELLRIHPVPVVMISSHTRSGAKATVEALDLGAIDFIAKPEVDAHVGLSALSKEILGKLYSAATANLKFLNTRAEIFRSRDCPSKVRKRVLIIGASTGGPKAIRVILQALPSNFPLGVLVAQHMPAGFTKELAINLNSTCRITVKEAFDGALITPGTVLVAPGGDFDMIVEKNPLDESAVVRVVEAQKSISPSPSIDRLMSSCAKAFEQNCIGVLLTGMGIDGAAGMEDLMMAGALTIAESEESCVIYGMPRAAIERGVASVIVSKEEIPGVVFKRMVF